MESSVTIASYIYERYKSLTEHEIDEHLLYRILAYIQDRYPGYMFSDKYAETADGPVFDSLVPLFRRYELNKMPSDEFVIKNGILIDRVINECI